MSGETPQAGDWVRVDTGETGTVVHTTRLTAFVKIDGEPAEATVQAFLLSQLIKIDPPARDAADNRKPQR
jgi:hypothetical protein